MTLTQEQPVILNPLVADLVLDVTRQVVAELAPEEFEYIDELIHPNDNNADCDDTMAFGVTEIIAPLTPAIWIVLSYTINKIFDATVSVATDTAKEWAKKRLGLDKNTIEPIPVELATELHVTIISNARKYGLTEEQALRLSILLIERLERH